MSLPLAFLVDRKRTSVVDSYRLLRRAGTYSLAGIGGLLALLAMWPSPRREGEGRGDSLKPTWHTRYLRVREVVSALFSVVYSKSLRNMTVTAFALAMASRAFEAKSRRSGRVTGRVKFRVFFLSIWALFYSFKAVEVPVVKYRHDVRFLVHIVEKASLATRTYWPCFWAFNRHAQTVVLNILSNLEWIWTHVHWRHATVPAVDGNVLDVYWASTDGDRAGGDALSRFASSAMPIAVLVPGIGGDIDDPYIKRMARACLANGWRVATHAYWRLDFHNTTDLTSVLEAIAEGECFLFYVHINTVLTLLHLCESSSQFDSLPLLLILFTAGREQRIQRRRWSPLASPPVVTC